MQVRQVHRMSSGITITDRAAETIRIIVGAKYGLGLRVKVVEGGGRGLEYKMDLDSPSGDDRVFEKNGARVLLDAKSMLHLSGTKLDYKEGLMQSSFVFNNPNINET